jgi:alpha-L-rhamnosidase
MKSIRLLVLTGYLVLLQATLAHRACGSGTESNRPARLTINFLEHADRVFLNGYPVNTPLIEARGRKESFQFSEIRQKVPFFGWIVNSDHKNAVQEAYHILVSSTFEKLNGDIGDLWDSGKVNSNQSVNISYGGLVPEPGQVYFWKVKTWDNHGVESSFSHARSFLMSDTLEEYSTAVYPLQKQDVGAIMVKSAGAAHYFADFGKAGFGRLRLNLFGAQHTDTVIIRMGEAQKNGRIDREPGGTIRYASYRLSLNRGWNTYLIALTPDRRNTGANAILMPEYIGEVLPFRYVEVENYLGDLQTSDLIRETVFYPADDLDSDFSSNDTILNQVWELCKYSIKATSFAGIYVDGDRERIPYEADALINQLSHYGVSREYSMARASHEYLIHRPTWPTEWILQSVLMAWEDYMYTGNEESFLNFYDDLKAKTLMALADEQGFISTRTGRVTPEVLKSIHFSGQLRDIVDWPHTGILGLEKNEGGETDGFVFTDINTVVNAFHYRALVLMSKMAAISGKSQDAEIFSRQAAKLKKSYNDKLLNGKTGIYVDGIGTDHSSLHANMFPLAFGLVPEKNVEQVTDFIRSRGMACSVYGSQFLLDAVYDGNDEDYGLQLLTSTGERSWYNMIRVGSTISLEAWDNKYKPNQDWNHAWGAAPANLIPRKLMGIEPLEPGFRKIRIRPQPANLRHAEIRHPTICGDILVSFHNDPDKFFNMDITIPANTTAEVYLPLKAKNQKVTADGQPVAFRAEGRFAVVSGVGSGSSRFEVRF